jgi:hypothetical protein
VIVTVAPLPVQTAVPVPTNELDVPVTVTRPSVDDQTAVPLAANELDVAVTVTVAPLPVHVAVPPGVNDPEVPVIVTVAPLPVQVWSSSWSTTSSMSVLPSPRDTVGYVTDRLEDCASDPATVVYVLSVGSNQRIRTLPVPAISDVFTATVRESGK